MRKVLVLLILILVNSLNAQNSEEIKTIIKGSSNSDIIKYIAKAKADGISLEKAEEVISIQGGTFDEISKLRELWNNNEKSDDINSNELLQKPKTKTETETDFLDLKEKKNQLRFGESFFKKLEISETPQLYLATPKDYRLGPGDELLINLFGASERTYSIEITREGNAKIDRLAPIYLSGLSISQAKSRLKLRLSKIYTGLNSKDEINKVDIDVSLQKARSIVVNIVGNVQVPGTYTISGFSSVLNALYYSGGPNNIGSYRNIQIIRSGKNITNIDLYDYFSRGIYPSFYLRDQDVIFIPAFNNQIQISSGLKTNGIFELKQNESFNDLLLFSGGFLSNSYKEILYVERINGLKKDFIEINKADFNTTIPKDGDIVAAKIPNDYIENKVTIDGSIVLPGSYSLKQNRTIKDLIENAKGFTRDALSSNIFVYRSNSGIQDEILSVNYENDQEINTEIKVLDSVFIPSKGDLKISNPINIVGYVKNDTLIEYKKNMTVSDAIILAGGFVNESNIENVNVVRNVSSAGEIQVAQTFNIQIDNNFQNLKKFYLKPYDLVSVLKKDFLKNTGYYTIIGEVKTEGVFPIKSQNEKFSEIFKGIDLKSTVNYDGIFLQRNGLTVPIIIKNNSIIENDLEIMDGDIINFSKLSNTITVRGEVQNELIVPFNKKSSLIDLISNSGGYTELASKKNIYVVYSNGISSKTKNFLGILNFPKLEPGCTIFVPTKEMKEKTSISEILSISSGIVSLIALVKIVGQ